MPELIARSGSGDYPIMLTQGSLAKLGERTATVCRGRRAVLVTDDRVAPLYLTAATQSLENAGFVVSARVLPAGEPSKSAANVMALYAHFHQAGLSRSDPVIALGGGVIGDLTGFAAATYLRGVPLIQVPTTLLAQVDSSIGGKTGIDLPEGKNLVGAFYPPRAVIMDPGLLRTLPRRQMAEGMAEVIKYGLIRDLALLEQIEQQTYDLEWVLERCVRIKIGLVAQDERDTGERMILNFGHTVGHAIEKVTGYQVYSHGEAVAIGMVMAAAVGEYLGETEPGCRERITQVLQSHQLPVRTDLPAGDVIAAIRSDKKQLAGRIHYVLLRRPGEAILLPMEPARLEQVLSEVWRHV
jgi:3-dehydroquinate synthase